MDTKIFSTPSHFQGIWFCIHLFAIVSITPELISSYMTYIQTLAESFKCNKCKKHFIYYITNNPMNKYANMTDSTGRNIGMFYWSWEFHNAVNKYLGKYQPTFEEAFNYFIEGNSGICTHCTEGAPFSKDDPNRNSLINKEVLSGAVTEKIQRNSLIKKLAKK